MAASAFAAEGNPASTNGPDGWFSAVVRELFATQLPALLLAAGMWICLGTLGGIALAVLVILASRRAGLWRSGWRYARWVRWPLYALMVVTVAGCLALAGFWHGLVRGGETVLRESQLATKVFPLAGDALADAAVSVQVALDRSAATKTTNDPTDQVLKAFADGRWELDAVAFSAQLDEFRSGMVSNVLLSVERSAVTNVPALAAGFNRSLLRLGLGLLGNALVENELSSGLASIGVDQLQRAIRERLPVVAARSGPPTTVTRGELSAFFVQEALVPMLMVPLKAFANANILGCLLAALVAVVVPPLLFFVTLGRIKRAPTPEDASSPGVPAGPSTSTDRTR